MTIAEKPATPRGTGRADRINGSSRTRRRNVLAEIADRRRHDLAPLLDGPRPDVASAPEPRPILESLVRPGLHLVAEIKRRSPSAGEIAGTGEDIVARARAYEAGGATAISVLCEPNWFGGSIDDLRAVRRAVGGPVLAKEFVVEARDEREIVSALDSGARLLGVNNRDLRTLEVDPERAIRLRERIPDDRLVLAGAGGTQPATDPAGRGGRFA